MDVLQDWDCAWMWDNLTVEGEEDWIVEAIAAGECMAVTDGSYMEDVDSSVCSASFIFECSRGRGRIFGSFCEQSSVACSYRGELLGLLAMHLILLGVETAYPATGGRVDIYSDCLTALWTVENLPPTMIPSRFKHADILKIILTQCGQFAFDKKYIHVPAHQDDTEEFETLTRQSQLNCIMDHWAKECILNRRSNGLRTTQLPLPLEVITVYAGKDKVTSQAGAVLGFWAHKANARALFSARRILDPPDFDAVDWDMVHTTLTSVPRLFQVWACKQVMGIAGTFAF